MLNVKTIQKILGIEGKVSMTTDEMVKEMSIAFYPHEGKNINNEIKLFSEKLKESLLRVGVKVVDYNSSLEHVPVKRRIIRIVGIYLNNIKYILSKILKSKGEFFYISFSSLKRIVRSNRLKKGVSVIVLGELEPEELPMQFISSFKTNSIIHILKYPMNINSESKFEEHFDTAMSLFAYNMANIVICVDSENWMVYNFNASHPVYKINDGKFDEHLLHALVPKIVAPISPNKFSEFEIKKERFDVNSEPYKKLIEDLKSGAILFEKTKLFPKGKKIEDLPFRDNFHKLIGKLHLDNRSGMSFGFISKQLPIKMSSLLKIEDGYEGELCFTDADGDLNIVIEIQGKGTYSLKIPEIEVLTLRSGSDKTHFKPESDLLILGLSNGKMFMKFPEGVKIHEDYKPSFDTKVILAHAVGNAIIASILNLIDSDSEFVKKTTQEGISISHWHGYFKEDLVPNKFLMYGFKNLHVACSSPQSAIYALGGKLESFNYALESKILYNGDVHVEPHHGTNVSAYSLTDLARYIVENPESTKLGNIYLKSE